MMPRQFVFHNRNGKNRPLPYIMHKNEVFQMGYRQKCGNQNWRFLKKIWENIFRMSRWKDFF